MKKRITKKSNQQAEQTRRYLVIDNHQTDSYVFEELRERAKGISFYLPVCEFTTRYQENSLHKKRFPRKK